MIVFRLQPVVEVIHRSEDDLPQQCKRAIDFVPVEALSTESFVLNPSKNPTESERREQKLVISYRDFMHSKGSVISRLRCRPVGEAKPIFSDLYDETRTNLLEAKGSGTRESVRMAIGQLHDYGRFVPNASKAVLLPERPREDLEALLATQQIAAVWSTDGTAFDDNAGGLFT